MDSDSSSDEGKMQIDVGEGEPSPAPASSALETEATEETARESNGASGSMAADTANTNVEEEDDDDEEGSEDEEDDDEDDDDGEEEGDEEEGEDDEEGDDDDEEDDENEEEGEEEEGEDSQDAEGLLEEEEEDGTGCPICHGTFTTQDLGNPESCDHTFCLECLLAWSRRVNTCPMDRSVFHIIFARHAGENTIYKKISVEDRAQQLEEEEMELEDNETANSLCQICQQGDREDILLLCDGCDRGWHCDCLDPPLSEVPVNEWFCPFCRAQNDDLEEDEEETFLSRRQIPRTMASERVRAAIRQARLNRARLDITSSEDEEAVPQPSTSAGPAKKTTPKRKRKTTSKKRKTTRRKRKTTKRKTAKGKTGKRKTKGRKGKRRKKRKTKAAKQPNWTELMKQDPRQRIFRSLGLTRPPAGRTIPMQKTQSDKPVDLGVSLSILGDSNALYSYSDEQQDVGTANVPAVPKRIAKYSISALLSHRQLGRPIHGDRLPAANKEEAGAGSEAAPSTSSSGLGLLDSIFQSQGMLHMQSQDITIKRDGSLHVNRTVPCLPPKKMSPKDEDKYMTFGDTSSLGERKDSIEEEENVESSGDDIRLVKDSKEESAPVEPVTCGADDLKADENANENAAESTEKLMEESVSQDNCDTDISLAREESASAGSPEGMTAESQDSESPQPSPEAEKVQEDEAERPEATGPEVSNISEPDVTGDSQDVASPAQNESQPSRKSDGEIESSDSNQYLDGENSQPEADEEPSQEAAGMEEDDNQDNNGEEGQVTSEEERGERSGDAENDDPDSKSASAKENVGDIRKVVISSRDDSANAEPWHKESLLVQVEVKGEGEEGSDDKEVEIVEPRKSPTPLVQIIISDSDDDKDRDERPKVPISELPRIPKRKKGDDGSSSASHSRGVLSRLDVDSKDYRSWEKRKSRHEGDREGRERSRGESRRHRDRSREDRHSDRSRDEGRHRHRRSEHHSSRGHSYERHDESGERERDRDRDRDRHRSRSRDRSRRRRHERHERSRSRDYDREVERESRHKRKKRDRDRSRERDEYRSRRSRSRSRSPRRRDRSAADKGSHERDYYEKQNSNGSGRSEESHGHGSKRHSSEPMPFQDSKRSKLYGSHHMENSPDKDASSTPLADDNFSEDNLSNGDQEDQEELSDTNKSPGKSESPPPAERSERPPQTEAPPTVGGEPAEYDPAHPTEEDLERAGDQEEGRSHFLSRSGPPPDAVLLPGGELAPGMLAAAGDGGVISPQNIPLPGMAFLPPGMPPGMRPPVLVNPVLMNRPPPFRQLPPHMPPSRFGWAPGMPVSMRNQFPGMGGMPPQPGMINGGMDPMGQEGGMGGPPHGQPQMLPVSTKGGFLPQPPAPPRMMGPGDGAKPSPQLEEISKLLNMPAFARRPGAKDDGLFKVPLPPQSSWKPEGMGTRQAGRDGGDPMESTEVVDMDMSPLDDECELELPAQAGSGLAATSADNLSKKLVTDLGKAIEKLSARHDDTPSSAVDLSNHQKFLEKVHMQERVVEEVKMAIKPFYASKAINKQEYKDIMRKAVPKICRCKSGRINPVKVKKLVEAYVEKCRRSHSHHSGHKEKKSGTPHKDSVKANGERQKSKSSR